MVFLPSSTQSRRGHATMKTNQISNAHASYGKTTSGRPSSSLPSWILRSLLSRRTVNKMSWSIPRQTRICYIFRLRVIIQLVLLKQISLYLLSHFCIRIIVLTCPDNKSARNHQPKSCVPAKSHKSQWCEANIISIEIFAQFVPVRMKTREYHH